MDEILFTRKAYGDSFATKFLDGTIVPWKLLSTKDYMYYNDLLAANVYPLAFVEDEIFCKCVLDQSLVKNIDILKAGIVSHVAQAILQYSGPYSPSDIEQALELKRHEASNILHDIVIWICQAFPGYVPDDLYMLSYHDLMLRFAQAEIKLLRAGIITEPFSFYKQGEEKQQKPKKATARLNQTPIEKSKPPKKNMAKQFEEQQQDQTIITKADIIESQMGMSGHDLDIVAHQKAAEDTAALYPEYIEQMKRGEKIRIPSVEERKAAAEARAKVNKAKYDKAIKEDQAFTKVELERLKVEREKERQRRAKQRQR